MLVIARRFHKKLCHIAHCHRGSQSVPDERKSAIAIVFGSVPARGTVDIQARDRQGKEESDSYV